MFPCEADNLFRFRIPDSACVGIDNNVIPQGDRNLFYFREVIEQHRIDMLLGNTPCQLAYNFSRIIIPHGNSVKSCKIRADFICNLINHDPNLVGKGGANSVYGFALKKEKLGVSFKFVDGTEHLWPLVILEVLKGLGALSKETEERFKIFHPYTVHNDNDTLVGVNKPCFEVKI